MRGSILRCACSGAVTGQPFQQLLTPLPGKRCIDTFERSKINDGVHDGHFFYTGRVFRQVADFILAVVV